MSKEMQILRYKLLTVKSQKLHINEDFHFMYLESNDEYIDMVALVDTSSRIIEVDINMYHDNNFVPVVQAYLGSVRHDGTPTHICLDATGLLDLDELF